MSPPLSSSLQREQQRAQSVRGLQDPKTNKQIRKLSSAPVSFRAVRCMNALSPPDTAGERCQRLRTVWQPPPRRPGGAEPRGRRLAAARPHMATRPGPRPPSPPPGILTFPTGAPYSRWDLLLALFVPGKLGARGNLLW